MSEMKHTPGPWLTDRNNAHSGQIATIYGCLGNDWVEVWTGSWCFEDTLLDEERQEANARLIAAAPELLDALQAAKNTLVAFKFQPGEANCWEHHDEENLAMVDAAIAKATGGQP